MAEIVSRWLQKGTPDDAFKECVATVEYARKENSQFLMWKADVTMVDALKDSSAYTRVFLLYASKATSDVDSLYSRLSAHFGLRPASGRPGAPRTRPMARPPFYLLVGI